MSEIRSEVMAFAEVMELRLQTKDGLVASGEWCHWRHCERKYLMEKLLFKVADTLFMDNLPIAMQNKALIDAANFAMMLFDRNNLGDEERK